MVVRTPQFWILAFDKRDVAAEHFETLDENEGQLTVDFSKAVVRCFSGTEDPPFMLPANQESDAALLTQIYQRE